MPEVASLDERWLAFVEATDDAARRHPLAAIVRQELFRAIVVGRSRVRRPALPVRPRRRERSLAAPAGGARADVALWVDAARDVNAEPLLATTHALRRLGLRSILLGPRPVLERLGPAAGDAIPVLVRPQSAAGRAAAIDALMDAAPSLARRGERAAAGRLMAIAAGYEASVARALSPLGARALVLSNDQFVSGAAACAAARRLGLSSLVLLHGAVSAFNAPVSADRMAVWGEVSRDQMEALGVAPVRLVVTGSPRHDAARPDPSARSRLAAMLGLDGRPVVTFFSNGNDLHRNTEEAVRGCAEWVSVAARELRGEVLVLVRLHPNESGDLYRGLEGIRVASSRECDATTLLAGSHAIGGLCSTTLTEALLYGTPVLQLRRDAWPELADNWRRGMAEPVTSAAELVAVVRRCLASGAVSASQAPMRERAFANHGRAADAIAGEIAVLCERAPSAPAPAAIPDRRRFHR